MIADPSAPRDKPRLSFPDTPIPATPPVVAFSGSRHGLNHAQIARIERIVLALSRDTLIVTGACMGVDACVAMTAFDAGYRVHTVVPYEFNYRYYDRDYAQHCQTSEFVRTYADRNARMVELSTDGLIAFPLFPEDDRRSRFSGTWQTVRMARKAEKAVQIHILSEAAG